MIVKNLTLLIILWINFNLGGKQKERLVNTCEDRDLSNILFRNIAGYV